MENLILRCPDGHPMRETMATALDDEEPEEDQLPELHDEEPDD